MKNEPKTEAKEASTPPCPLCGGPAENPGTWRGFLSIYFCEKCEVAWGVPLADPALN